VVRGNENAQIKRIEYNGGNRKPAVKASADHLAAAIPMTVNYHPQERSTMTVTIKML